MTFSRRVTVAVRLAGAAILQAVSRKRDPGPTTMALVGLRSRL